MNRLRTLIVDDEPLARTRMRSLLQQRDDVVILAECCDGRQAVQAITQLRPQLIFLDIEMPELDGFQVVQAIDGPGRPAIVFVTAFNEYAVRAFELNTMDYLLKPFDADRLGKTISRVQTALASGPPFVDFEQRVIHVLDQLQTKSYVDRLAVKSGGRLQLLPVGEIEWIEAAGNYVRLHSAGREFLLRESMKGLETRLDPGKFVRIHRSTIVSLDRIESFEPTFHGDYHVCMKDGTRLPLSRNYRHSLRARFGDQL